MPSTNPQAIEYFLHRGVEMVYPDRKTMQTALTSGKKLTMYLGIDPTGPNLHFGHMIVLEKLRQWQELGHQVNLLIGDFTGLIGDPTDKSAARKQQTSAEVKANAKKYKKQAGKILSFSGKNPAKVLYNSKWLGKLKFADVVELCTHFTVQRMLERDMFSNRMKEGKPIHLHEFMYPLMQGYDSMAMDVDAEVGGNDQTFNMLTGRDLMKTLKNKEKFVVTMKLLTDSSGVKAGKTTGNIVALDAAPNDMYGAVMSWVDSLILPGFELLTTVSNVELGQIQQAMHNGANPKEYKMKLAHAITARLHNAKAADAAQAHFIALFQKHEQPTEMETVTVTNGNIIEVLVATKMASSKSDARQLLTQHAIRVNDQSVTAFDHVLSAGTHVVQRGKRQFKKIVVKG